MARCEVEGGGGGLETLMWTAEWDCGMAADGGEERGK